MEEHDPFRFAEDTWRGRSVGSDASLDNAIADAWDHAKSAPNPPQKLRVIDIFVEGTNPISEYSVTVGRV